MNNIDNENLEILNIAENLKNNIKKIQSQINTQTLLIESIDFNNTENVKKINECSQKFVSTIYKMKKDPRNLIIIILALIIIALTIYVIKF